MPSAVSVLRISAWRTWRHYSSLILVHLASALRRYRIPFEGESLFVNTAVRVEPQVQRMYGGYYVPTVRQMVAAIPPNHVFSGGGAVVDLIIVLLFRIHNSCKMRKTNLEEVVLAIGRLFQIEVCKSHVENHGLIGDQNPGTAQAVRVCVSDRWKLDVTHWFHDRLSAARSMCLTSSSDVARGASTYGELSVGQRASSTVFAWIRFAGVRPGVAINT